MTPALKAKLQVHLVNHMHELVFVNRRSRPFSRNKVVETVLQPALEKSGSTGKAAASGFMHSVTR
jgi:hypothetical protein